MKKRMLLLSVLLIVMCLSAWAFLPASAEGEIIAEGTCGDDLTWTLDDAGLLTISGTGEMSDYSWSDQPSWYSSQDGISTVVIEDGVTNIGSCAFWFCEGLTDISIPNSVASIGSNAFRNCTNLTNIAIPENVASIGSYAFAYCYKLTNVAIPDGITVINGSTFEGCNSLEYIVLPASIKMVDVSAFNIELYAAYPGRAPEIDVWHVLYKGTESQRMQINAFYYDNYYDKFEVDSFLDDAIWHYGYTEDEIIDPETQYCSMCDRSCPHKWDDGAHTKLPTETETGIRTFTCSLCGETKTEEIPILSNLAGIEDLQYEIENGEVTITGCDITAGGNLVIPETIDGYPVTSIGYRAFYECTNLFGITIPEGVTYIADHAFSYCELVYIVLPESLELIGLDAFRNGTSSFYAQVFPPRIQVEHVLYRGTRAQEWTIMATDGGDFTDGGIALPRGTWHYECTGGEIVDGVCTICNPPCEAGDIDGNDVVDTDDAIYLLYFTLFGESSYPVNQPCDYDGNGVVDTDDAIYLLYHTLFGEGDYPLN